MGFTFYTPFNEAIDNERSAMIFNRVYLNVDDNEYYVEDIGTTFDNFWSLLSTKGVIGKVLYKMIFYTIVGMSKITGKCKKACIKFD